MDILGWEFRLNTNDIQASSIGFIAIAVALLGRNTAVGRLLLGAPVRRARDRHVDEAARPDRLPAASSPSNLTSIIQGLVVLFVGADVLILYIWQARKRVGRRITPDEGVAAVSTLAETPVAGALLSRLPRGARAARLGGDRARPARLLGLAPAGQAAHVLLADHDRLHRDHARDRGLVAGNEHRLGGGAVAAGLAGIVGGVAATLSSVAHLDNVVVWSALIAAALVYATPLDVRRDRRPLLRAQRRREHRPRGDDADGRVLRHLGPTPGPARGSSGSCSRC